MASLVHLPQGCAIRLSEHLCNETPTNSREHLSRLDQCAVGVSYLGLPNADDMRECAAFTRGPSNTLVAQVHCLQEGGGH